MLKNDWTMIESNFFSQLNIWFLSNLKTVFPIFIFWLKHNTHLEKPQKVFEFKFLCSLDDPFIPVWEWQSFPLR